MLKKHHRFMWNFTGSFVRSLRRPVFVYLSSLAVTLQLFFAILFYQAESNVNQNVLTFFDALYYTVTVMTGVGLGDIHPVSVSGRIISIFMMLAGTVLFVSFTGVLAASILQIEARHHEDTKAIQDTHQR